MAANQQTPYELLRRSHRSAQRQVEKDFAAVQGLAKTGGGGDRAAALAKLDAAAERAKGLKRKLEDLQPAKAKPSPLRERVHYFDKLAAEVQADASEHTLDRYIVDYLLRSGQIKAARALAAQQGIDDLVDLKLFGELQRIESALVMKHSVVEALAWCGEHRGTLKKMGSNLEFKLRLQEFVELCRTRDTAGAIAYARKNLAPWAKDHLGEIQQGMTLLAFGETTGVTAYRDIYDATRWKHVRDQFRGTFLDVYALPSQPLLSLALSAGLASLRLPSCAHDAPAPAPADAVDVAAAGGATAGAIGLPSVGFTIHAPPSRPASLTLPAVPLLPAAPPLHAMDDGVAASEAGAAAAGHELRAHPDAAVGNIDCPTCGDDLRVLAREVPMAHHTNSTIVCRISGLVMDSDNEPMAFPNGYVYSHNALLEMAKNNFDVVTCPRTRETCAFARLRKVYIS